MNIAIIKDILGNMNWLQIISIYMLIGLVNTFVIDWWHNLLVKITKDGFEQYTNWERVVLIVLWPVYATIFWFIFFKSFFKKNE